MNELAVFTGIGGGILGTQMLGINTVCGIELDSYCRRVLVRRQNDGCLPPFPIWDDVRTFDCKPWVSSIDIVTGGFPCQAFSTAAHGNNTAVDLWPEMLRTISEITPRYVFCENVTKNAIERSAADLAALDYEAEMLALSAADLGADHVRPRYWLLAYTDDKSKLRRTVNAKMAELQGVCQSIWETEPTESGMVDGVTYRMDRYKAIGNSQVPIVAATALWALANA